MRASRRTQPFRRGSPFRRPGAALQSMLAGRTAFGQNPMDLHRAGQRRASSVRRRRVRRRRFIRNGT